tara:strand:+ start:7711 stop:8772 length:1062 start_codon:yes stop_codon:yes gene_type:complete
MNYNKGFKNPYTKNISLSQFNELETTKDYIRFYENSPTISEEKVDEKDARMINTVVPSMGKGGAFIKSGIKKYNPGGEIAPIPMAKGSSAFLAGSTPVGSYSDVAGNTFDMGDMGGSDPLMSGFTPANVIGTAVSLTENIVEAAEAKKEFNKNLEDSQAVDKKRLKDLATEQRTAQGEAIGEAAGTAIGALVGMPGLGGKAGKFLGNIGSKIKGKKFGEKINRKFKKEQGEHLDFKTGEEIASVTRTMREDESAANEKYLSSLGILKYGGNFNGMVYGKRHEDGGVMMYKDGAPIAEVEGDEYVINNDILKDKPESKKKYSISGTPVQIASALNSINKYGVNSHPGGVVKQVS